MKPKTKARNWPKIRRRTIRGNTYYTIDCGMVDGKRKILTRASKKVAEVEAEKIRVRYAKVGNDALRLKEHELRDAAQALAKLGKGNTLTEAVDFFLLHSKGEGGAITVSELYDAYVQTREDANRAPSTMLDIRHRLGRVTEEFGDKPAHYITTGDLEEWLRRQNGGPRSKANYRKQLSGLFNFAVQRRHIRFSPAASLTVPSERKDKRPAVFELSDARKLMNAAAKHEPEMVPYFALCLFAGVRPGSEAKKMIWEAVDFEKNDIYVTGEISKTGFERFVKLQPNLVAWLRPFKDQEGPLLFSPQAYKRVREEAGVAWGHDITRHSFGSYHLAAFRNAGDTAEQMGHASSTKMLFTHYRRAVREQDALKYWEIRPSL